MSQLEPDQYEQAERTSLATTIGNESLAGATDFAARCSPRAVHSPAPGIGVVVICVPSGGGRHDEELAGRLSARLRGMDYADVVRTLAERFELQRDQGKLPIIGEVVPRCGAEAETSQQTRAGDARHASAHDCRALLTLLFTDIVGSTGMVDQLGDGAWRALLAKHNAIVRTQLTNFGGNEVDNAGDGFFAVFDRPTRAVRCAENIRADLQALGIAIRAAIHTAECETGGECVSGVAVHVAARMVSVAKPGEIIVSNTVRELVEGSGLEFSDGSWHTLRGLSGRRRLFALKRQSQHGLLTHADEDMP
jgi:class 3 adenylate cyclase